MSALVSRGVKKGVKLSDDKAAVEVTFQDVVAEHGIGHQVEETLEILQGECQRILPENNIMKPKAKKLVEQFFWCLTPAPTKKKENNIWRHCCVSCVVSFASCYRN